MQFGKCSKMNSVIEEKSIAIIVARALYSKSGRDISDEMHGCAVWCLSSGLTDSVEYHIDYAELYRYETDIICPPLLAGTIQVSPVHNEEDMKGGDFMVNTNGLNHYKKFGYKGKLSSVEDLSADLSDPSWKTIRYRCNRGIIHDGTFPHLSTPITHLSPGLSRVIIGLNFFSRYPAELGECCQRAPEHSDAFNRTIRLYQTLNSTCPINKMDDIQMEDNKVKKGISAKEVLKNPALAKLLVAAAKKMKQTQQEGR